VLESWPASNAVSVRYEVITALSTPSDLKALAVNFDSLEAASSARNALNGREFLGSEIGPIKVGYARAPGNGRSEEASPSSNNYPSSFGANNTGLPNGRSNEPTKPARGTAAMTVENVANIENYGSNLVMDLINKGDDDSAPVPQSIQAQAERSNAPSPVEGDVNEQQMVMATLSQGDSNLTADVQAVGSK
jgi:protein JSN1